MNCHQHEFGVFQHEGRDNGAISSIPIHHNVAQPLSTAYEEHKAALTPGERGQRDREAAFARARAMTKRYGGDMQPGLPVAKVIPQPIDAEVTWATPTKGKRVSEPGSFVLKENFRKSASSLMSSDSNLSNGVPKGIPPPPPLKTEVTSLLMNLAASNTQQQDVTREDGIIPSEQSPRRTSDSILMVDQTPEFYQSRSSFQADTAVTFSSTQAIIPRQPSPQIYPDLPIDPMPEVIDDRTENNEGGLLRGLAIDSQAHLLEQYQKQQETRQQPKTDKSALAVQEQEQLWQQLRNGPASSPRSVTRLVSPMEEQAMLWEQLRNNNNNYYYLSAAQPATATSAIEEQAMLWEQLRNNSAAASRPATRQISAMEEQAQLLEHCARQRAPRNLSAVEEQSAILQQIQDAKERKIVEMVCQASLTNIIADSRNEENREQALMQLALERSQEEAIPIERRLAAELAFQTSDQIGL